MSDATALSRANAYPAYDPAGAVQAYVDEFGALQLAGWIILGVGLALVVRATSRPTAALDALAARGIATPAPAFAQAALAAPAMSASSPSSVAVAALQAPAALPERAAPSSASAIAEPAVPPKPAAELPAPERRQMIVTRDTP